MFVDRNDAGERLAAVLAPLSGEKIVVLGLPRGGIPVAALIAERLGAPLDLMMVRKIGVPGQPELAMGAVVDGTPPAVVRNDDIIRHARVGPAEFEVACRREIAEIERRRRLYGADRAPTPVENAVVIVVDDGIATGATMRAALAGLARMRPARVLVATPVAPRDVAARLRADGYEVVCLDEPASFEAIGLCYADFRQVDDAEVKRLLQENRNRRSSAKSPTVPPD